MAVAAVAVVDAQRAVVVVAVVQAQAHPMARRAAIHEEQGAGTVATTVEPVAARMATLYLGVMPISHHAMMPISRHGTTHNLPTTHHATSARAHRKSAIAPVVAAVMEEEVVVVAAAWAVNAAKRHVRRARVASRIRCAPAST